MSVLLLAYSSENPWCIGKQDFMSMNVELPSGEMLGGRILLLQEDILLGRMLSVLTP
jgi:hypothetical protein